MNPTAGLRMLNPTLWRTCRMLAGVTRLKLMRQLHRHPGASVSELARAARIGVSDASQELRRIQSRGLLQVERRGSFAYYRFGADPQVPSAAPLVKALKAALAVFPEKRDPEIARIARGLAHPRRITLAKALVAAPRKPLELQRAANIPQGAVSLHLAVLRRTGWVVREGGWLVLRSEPHPVARALVRLLQE